MLESFRFLFIAFAVISGMSSGLGWTWWVVMNVCYHSLISSMHSLSCAIKFSFTFLAVRSYRCRVCYLPESVDLRGDLSLSNFLVSCLLVISCMTCFPKFVGYTVVLVYL